MKNRIISLFKKRIVLLDGALGTELHKLGMPDGVSPELWCLENPNVLSDLHLKYINSGSDIIYTATFGANRLKLSLFNVKKDVSDINKRLALIAKEVSSGCLVAGDIGPLGKFIKPFGELDFEEAVDIFKEQIKGLLLGGVDLFVIETMMDIQEARAALLAVKELTDKFVITTMTFQNYGKTISGNDPISSLITLQSLGADAFGLNCSTGPQDMVKIIKLLKPYSNIPLVAKPNAGIPTVLNNKTTFNMSPIRFSYFGEKLVLAGANFIGGCCGTTPEHIALLNKKIKNLKPIQPKNKKFSILTSPKKFVEFKDNFIVIGEKINPTNRKELQEDLKKEKFTTLRYLAKEQEKHKASLLDVNVSFFGVKEKELIKKAISVLVNITELPLVIDSSDLNTIKEALRFYPARALVNSVSLNKNTEELLSIIKKYGAMFIILPISKKIPKDFKEKKDIIKEIIKIAKKFGFTKEDFIIDGLALTISSNENSAIEALKVIKWANKVLKAHTTIGLSNISFGLPKRDIINRVFLGLAKKAGLSSAICNPKDNKPIKNKIVEDLLFAKKGALEKFIKYYSKKSTKTKKVSVSIEDRLFNAILNGEKDIIVELLDEALLKFKAQDILNSYLIPAIIKVGDLFEKKEYFLPQLILSAETLKKAIEHLKPHFEKENIDIKKGKILLATVEGDVHDIGKNIVGLLLKNYGFEVIDLGKDVKSKKIISAIKKYLPDVVGLSALMTTTMLNMKKVIELSKRHKLNPKFILGGAVVNEPFATSLGASYAKDAVSAVKAIENLVKK